jgi:PKD repeat protein
MNMVKQYAAIINRMRNHFAVKYLLAFIFFTAITTAQIFAQTITIGNVDPGPYGPGSTITVPFHVNDASGCIGINNVYSLYMSDASGNFNAAAAPVDTIHAFYGTFLNYTLPANLPAGSNYKFMITSSSLAASSAPSNSIIVNAAAGVVAAASSASINTNYINVFGQCIGSPGSFIFTDQSTGASTVTATFFNEATQAPEGVNVSLTNGYTFNAKTANYTVTIKAVSAGGIVGTYSYQLINNQVSSSIGFTGNPTVCLTATGAPLTYNIDLTSLNGIQFNYPGDTYTFSWGDGSTSVFTLCQLKADSGRVTHVFTKPSCGLTTNGQVNSFKIDFQVANNYCGRIGSTQTSYAKIIIAPTAEASFPPVVCDSTAVTFINKSVPGPDPNSTVATCQNNPNALYTWIVDGVVKKQNYKLGQNFIYTFTTTGVHTITLHPQTGNGSCAPHDTTQTICVQVPPKPSFTLPKTICTSTGPVIPVNTSIVDTTCGGARNMIWSVKGPAAVGYAGGTSANSNQPQFTFSAAGIYLVQLSILACDTVKSAVDTLIVNTTPVAVLSQNFTWCNVGQTFNFNATQANNPTYTILTGTAQELPTTYQWVVTPPPGSRPAIILNDTSRYPKITFPDPGTYTITVTHQNGCGNISATQNITFINGPNVLAGQDTAICSGAIANLHGVITGAGVTNNQWTGGGGKFTPDRNTLQATYKPTPAEISAGNVTLTLLANTSLAPPCDAIRSMVTITILPIDTVTSAKNITVCADLPINYTITSGVPSATFAWTAVLTSGSATGFTNGSGTLINDIITNSSKTVNAVVTYTIIPQNSPCIGSGPFILTVTIPAESVGFTLAPKSGCGNLTVQFTNTSANLASAFLWKFGDGTTSTATSPQHTFAPRTDGKDTTYKITLTGPGNCRPSMIVLDSVLVRPAIPVAKILPGQTIGCGSFSLTVINDSPGNNILYDYYLYDGPTLLQHISKTDKSNVIFNPVNPPIVKTYTVYMVATGYCNNTGTSISIPITVAPNTLVAQTFEKNNTTKGCAPLNLTFINNSSGGSSFHYNIYDANNNIIAQPVADTGAFPYTFNKPGTYYVTLTASNSCVTAESNPPLRIDVFSIPKPDFVTDIASGCNNITVNLTNLTTDSISQPTSLSYEWDFGDGTPHSFLFNPSAHTYHYSNSPYTVTLTATNTISGCSNVVIKKAYIVVNAPPGTNFTVQPDTVTSIPNYHFSFVDETTGSPVSWLWKFSDGQTSSKQNPEITFADTGTYKVTLTTINKFGCDSTFSRNVKITGVPGQLYIPNAFIPTSATAALRVFIAKGSGIKTWHMQIFNNYGQLVWETTKLTARGEPVEGWDGTYKGVPAQQGVYVWQTSATFINGTEWKGMSYNNSSPKSIGSVHLIR